MGPLTTDQRGFTRFCWSDMGAYEAQSLKSVNDTTALPGDLLTYTLSIHNGGLAPSFYQLTDTLPISLTYLQGSLTATSGDHTYQDSTISWSDTLNASDIVTVTYATNVNQILGTITNSAVISGGSELFIRTASVIVDGFTCDMQKYAGNPVLTPGSGGSWDGADVWEPSVLKVAGSYMMWYTGYDSSDSYKIGLATSPDGFAWTKHAANPLLVPGGGWDGYGVRAPTVIYEQGQYKMWYTGYDSN